MKPSDEGGEGDRGGWGEEEGVYVGAASTPLR